MFRSELGNKYGLLSVIAEDADRRHGQVCWVCMCDCGNKVTVLGSNLRKGNSTSCGCKRKQASAARMSTLNLRHGMTNTRVWRIWKGIIERTTDSGSHNYWRYGGRGIAVCDRWLSFELFLADMGEPAAGHSIERLDNNGPYAPTNCIWATAKTQAANRRTNRRVLIAGKRILFSEAAVFLGVSKSTIARRVQAGAMTEV